MDVFGGWSVEWEFKVNSHIIDIEDFDRAIEHKYKQGSRGWFQIENHLCNINKYNYRTFFYHNLPPIVVILFIDIA